MNILQILELIAQGMLNSLIIFVLTLIFALPLGLAVCAARMSKNKIVSSIIAVYISIMRGTPLMLQLFVVYYCPFYLFGIKLSTFGPNYRMIAVLIGFVLNYAAYFAEIYRSGISSVPVGQKEAAKVLGYSRFTSFLVIIMPQVWRRILPTVTNEVITLIKDTSLAYTIGVIEMFTKAKQLSASESNINALIVAGVIYYIFNAAVAFAMSKLEKKLGCYTIK